MKLITLKTFDNSIEAHLLKVKLESEGIRCFIFDQNIVSMNPLFNITVGGIKLNISDADQDKALSVLQELDDSVYTNEEGEIIKCPNCNSEKLYSGFKSMKSAMGIFSTIVSFLFMIFPFYAKTVYRCKECDTEFE